MIYVSDDQLDQVEYLLDQSEKGNHVLFEAEDVRRAFRDSSPDHGLEDSYSVEHHLERVISEPDLHQKRAYLDRLDPDTFSKVVRTYFNIIENNLFEKGGSRH